jgi:raffinose/stachyose/melibiose transport system substrate-binding protein
VFKQIVDLLAASSSTFIPYDNALPPALQEPFFQAAEQLIDDSITPEDALKELDVQLKRYHEQIGK